MSRLRLTLLAGLALAGCDRLEQQWPLKRPQGAVTVKLPPAKTATPGFAFNDGQKGAPARLR